MKEEDKNLLVAGVLGGLGGGLALFIIFSFFLQNESAWTYLIFFPVFYTLTYFLFGKFLSHRKKSK
ncbi:MAG: hypothetical protein GOU97_02145 [Nanoarchaeota archaeon]|nr:hypothetical protein [Nanoarchaeota archaeon]